mmetsp:Transcript_11537/g.32012  ORF Transcript_11537/g.32012 Transcript_11537/m.32012 type:complete len:261 (+) Transcript_11537:250-1032(+)
MGFRLVCPLAAATFFASGIEPLADPAAASFGGCCWAASPFSVLVAVVALAFACWSNNSSNKSGIVPVVSSKNLPRSVSLSSSPMMSHLRRTLGLSTQRSPCKVVSEARAKAPRWCEFENLHASRATEIVLSLREANVGELEHWLICVRAFNPLTQRDSISSRSVLWSPRIIVVVVPPTLSSCKSSLVVATRSLQVSIKDIPIIACISWVGHRREVHWQTTERNSKLVLDNPASQSLLHFSSIHRSPLIFPLRLDSSFLQR